MSHSHIRVAPPIARRRPWLELTFFVAFSLLALLFLLFVLWDRPHEPAIVEHGRILDTRIVVDDIRHGRFGGRIYYRLEVRVRYDLAGSPQDRWMVADTLSKSRELVAAQVAAHPEKCLVYWQPGHPNAPRCTLE